MLSRLAVLATVLTAIAPAAYAQHGPSETDALNGGQIVFELRLPEGTGYSVPDTELERDQYFNRASCLCSASASRPFAVRLTFSPRPEPFVSEPVELLTGEDCESSVDINLRCGPQNSDGELVPLSTSTDSIQDGTNIPIEVAQLVDPTQGYRCDPTDTNRSVWAIVDTNNDNTPENAFPYPIAVDTQPPPLPPQFTLATGAENAMVVSWDVPETERDDVEYWQLLCGYDDDGTFRPAFDTPPATARYITSTSCGVPDTITPTQLEVNAATDLDAGVAAGPVPDAGTAPDAGPAPDAGTDPDAGTVPTSLPAALAGFDPTYLCGEATGAATSIRVEGLENNEEYRFVLVAVDRVGNYAGAYIAGTVTPRPAVDFWEDLQEDGSEVEGGVCLLADTYGQGGGRGGLGGAITDALRRFRDETLAASAAGRWLTAVYYDHVAPLGELARGSVVARVAFAIVLLPVVALALAWHALTLPGLLAVIAGLWLLRRSRRGRLVAATAAVALAAPTVASAQSVSPYWDDELGDDLYEEHTPDDIRWHAGIKLGPYVPAIDAQTGADTYEEMFGGWAILPTFELDRVVLHLRAGQLTVGGSVGFFGKTAKAFVADDTPMDDEPRERTEGDETKFRMIPLHATAAFRLTMLDDEWGIPLVPYARGGLAYHLWWVRAPNGNLARDYRDADGMPCTAGAAGCVENKALGGSLGVVGALGLAIRAERIDPDSADSMRTSGIYHAGFYAELSMAKVDGFGSSTKLAVGDTTWFAGIDFEF